MLEVLFLARLDYFLPPRVCFGIFSSTRCLSANKPADRKCWPKLFDFAIVRLSQERALSLLSLLQVWRSGGPAHLRRNEHSGPHDPRRVDHPQAGVPHGCQVRCHKFRFARHPGWKRSERASHQRMEHCTVRKRAG